MTLAEFKAWFEGFCEGIGGAPTEQHLAKVREKLMSVRAEEPVLPWPSSPSIPGDLYGPIRSDQPGQFPTVICGEVTSGVAADVFMRNWSDGIRANPVEIALP